MSEDKYYIPTERELCQIGLEIEVLEKGTWTKKDAFDTYDFVSHDIGGFCQSNYGEIIKLLRKGKLRVKRLNKEDIEANEWEYINDLNGESIFTFGFNLWFLFFDEKNNTIRIENEHDNVFFNGTINNKSELKKVMEHIGITK